MNFGSNKAFSRSEAISSACVLIERSLAPESTIEFLFFIVSYSRLNFVVKVSSKYFGFICINKFTELQCFSDITVSVSFDLKKFNLPLSDCLCTAILSLSSINFG